MESTQARVETTPAAGGSVGDQVLNIIADVEKQLERLRSAQAGHVDQIVTLDQRTKAIEQAEQLVQSRLQEIQQRDSVIAQKAEVVEAERARLASQQDELRQAREAIEQTRAGVARDREDLQQLQHLLQDDQNRLAQAKADLEGRVQRENDELTRLRTEHAALTARLEKAEANVGELIHRIEGMQDELDRRQAAIDAATREKKDVQAQLESTRHEIAEAKSRADRAELEGLHLVEQAEAQRNEVAAKLAAAESSRAELSARVDAASAELTKIRTELAARLDVANGETSQVRAQLAERDAALADANEKLRVAGAKMAQFAEAIAKQAPEVEKGVAAIAECQSLRRTIERLEQDLKQRAGGDVAPLQAQIQQLSAALKEREQELESVRKQVKDRGGDSAEIESMRKEIDRLGQELEERDTALDGLREQHAKELAQLQNELGQAKKGGIDAAGAGLQEKAKLMQAFATHLKRRRQRLVRMRELVKSKQAKAVKPAAPDPDRARIAHEIQEKKQALVEVQRCLAASEQQMMRRWARPRAVATLAWATILLSLVGVGAWFGAGWWKPPVVAASVVLEAKAKTSLTPSEADFEAWQSTHEKMVQEGGFAATVAKRLGERQVPGLTDSTKLSVHLKENLTVDSDRPGTLRLTLKGEDGQRTLAVLDTVATTLINESAKSAGKRTDGMKAVVVGEKVGVGRVEYASINPIPIRDERLMYAAILFGAGVVAVSLIAAVTYTVLMRSKRIFDREMAIVEEDVTVPIR